MKLSKERVQQIIREELIKEFTGSSGSGGKVIKQTAAQTRAASAKTALAKTKTNIAQTQKDISTHRAAEPEQYKAVADPTRWTHPYSLKTSKIAKGQTQPAGGWMIQTKGQPDIYGFGDKTAYMKDAKKAQERRLNISDFKDTTNPTTNVQTRDWLGWSRKLADLNTRLGGYESEEGTQSDEWSQAQDEYEEEWGSDYDYGCFQAGTKIETDNGIKNIEDIVVGDNVKTYNKETNSVETSNVTETFIHPNNTSGLLLNGFIKTTTNHPFYSNGEWIDAGKLNIGDKVLHLDGTERTIETIELIETTETVYNFEVDTTHTYFAEGYLVHNKTPGGGGGTGGEGSNIGHGGGGGGGGTGGGQGKGGSGPGKGKGRGKGKGKGKKKKDESLHRILGRDLISEIEDIALSLKNQKKLHKTK